jgi:hypothetical protein
VSPCQETTRQPPDLLPQLAVGQGCVLVKHSDCGIIAGGQDGFSYVHLQARALTPARMEDDR